MTKWKVAVFFVAILIFSGFWTQKVYAAFDCLQLRTTSTPEQKNFCKDQLAQLEKEYNGLLKQLDAAKKNTGTLTGDVNYLTNQINALKSKIKGRALVIAELKIDISDKVNKIGSLSEKIDREHESLAQLLRNTNEFDNENIIHLILSDNTLSGFYSDLESYSSIKQSVKASVEKITGVKVETEEEKKALEEKRDAELDAKVELETAQKKVAQSEAEKKQLLAISKQNETAYQTLAAQKKAKADQIRSALFSLAGISQKIEFGTALEYANEVKSKLGIDPAFLLAILTQESNLGANVGQCYLTNPDTGAGVGKNTGTPFFNVMKPTRDVAPFLDITSKLHFNAYETAVSCPIAGVAGYGGAMGPAQFIPSTWKLFEPRLQSLIGSFPNPWAPRDAFMASGMYLTDLGAIGNSASAQNKAACRYYGSGGNYCSYSTSVARLKAAIQANIDLL